MLYAGGFVILSAQHLEVFHREEAPESTRALRASRQAWLRSGAQATVPGYSQAASSTDGVVLTEQKKDSLVDRRYAG